MAASGGGVAVTRTKGLVFCRQAAGATPFSSVCMCQVWGGGVLSMGSSLFQERRG